ncbi:hypothetical protein ACFLYK_04180 [Candidatus Cloacimonadota bacterium]
MMKILKTGFMICLFFLIISCTIKDFEAPEFDKKVQLPLLNEKYYMADLADTTDDYIIFVESDTLLFSISNDFETEYVDEEDLMIGGQTDEFESLLEDELMIESRVESTNVEVGNDLVVDSRETIIDQHLNQIEVNESGNAYAFIEILAFASEAIGEPVEPIYGEVIPPYYDFEVFNQDFTLFENENFEYVIIDTGSVYVTFNNNTELTLSSDLGQEFEMHFEFYTNGTAEADDGTYMFTHYIDHTIDPGEIADIVIPFDGNTVYMTNYLKCFLTTDGSDGPINVEYGDSFEVTFAVGNMTITEANAEIEAASLDHEDGISLSDDEIVIINAEIESCIGTFSLLNDLPFTIDTLMVEFYDLYDPQGQNLVIFETGIAAGSTFNLPIDLQNYFIESSSGNPLDSLLFNVYASIDPPSGFFVINQNNMVHIDITLGDMTLSQLTGIIDQISENSNSIDISDEDIQIQSAVISEGSFNFDFSGIEMIDPSTVTILFDEILDPVGGDPLEIVIDQFSNFQYDLSGHQMVLGDQQILNYHTTVHLDQLTTISNFDVVTADIILSDLHFGTVTGRFGIFEIEDEESAEVDSTGEFNLFYAEIEQCQFHISIPPEDYSLPFGSEMEINFHDIYSPSGTSLSLNIRCPGDTLIELGGYSLGNDPSSQTVIDSIYYSFNVITDGTGDEIMTLTSDLSVQASIEIGDIILQEVRGIINNKTIELEDITEEINLEDLPDSLDGLLDFQTVELHLNINNQTGFDCRLTMNIAASNASGGSVELYIDETIYAEAETEIVITEGVNEILDLIPDQISVTNIVAYIGDGETPGTISLNDSISGNYNVVSPMQFIINDYSVTESADVIELDDDDQDIIEDNLTSVKLTIEAENKLPLGADLRIYFATDSLLVFIDPGLVIDSLTILPAAIQDGITSEPSQNLFEIDLSGEDFNVFLDRLNQNVYPGIELLIMGTDGEVVSILGNDYIHIIGYIEAEVHIAEEEE